MKTWKAKVIGDKNDNYCYNDFCTPCFCVTENSTILLCSFSDSLWLEILAPLPLLLLLSLKQLIFLQSFFKLLHILLIATLLVPDLQISS